MKPAAISTALASSTSTSSRSPTIEGDSKRRVAVFGTIASTLAAGTVLAVTTAGGSSTATTIRLYEHDTSQAQVDLGAPGESAGDVFAFAGDTFKR
jgi:hypothetical protein